MILKTVFLSVSPKTFDVLFADFMLEKWKIAEVTTHNINNVRSRYEIHVDDVSTNTKFISEIERTPVSEQRLEIKVSACNINPPYAIDFIDSFNSFLYDKWKISLLGYLPDKVGLLSLATILHGMLRKFNIPENIIREEVDLDQWMNEDSKIKPQSINNLTIEERLSIPVDNPDDQNNRNLLLAELKKGLPPMDVYKTLSSIYLPKGINQQNKWKKAWKIKIKLDKEYTKLGESAPSIDDYRDALDKAKVFSKKPSERTARSIIKAGENNLL